MTTPPFSPLITLSDGNEIQQLGLGVYKVDDVTAAGLVEGAIAAGYRRVDTAKLYYNEAGVGAGVRASGIPREEIFVTTKVWNDDQGYDETLRAFDTSLGLLGMDYVDLYLIHWPAPAQDRYRDTWRALEALHSDGRVRSIGVSNFTEAHLERLLDSATETPVVNQVEVQPWLQQDALIAFNAANGIQTEAWSPLGRGRVLDDPTIARIAAKHERSSAQIVLRWHVQRGLLVIPKSNSLERIRENSRVFDFELDAADLSEIAGLETGERTGSHPDAVG
ncbi:2,5-diketo-D-gluconate reductase A [Conyzicola nivalis]|uniref:2,5-diketo-D-gluconate reductase A n=1 Tax=Conyzicola nivalis TaxID=1477021 RepID=A0ABV2QS42_9MICO